MLAGEETNVNAPARMTCAASRSLALAIFKQTLFTLALEVKEVCQESFSSVLEVSAPFNLARMFVDPIHATARIHRPPVDRHSPHSATSTARHFILALEEKVQYPSLERLVQQEFAQPRMVTMSVNRRLMMTASANPARMCVDPCTSPNAIWTTAHFTLALALKLTQLSRRVVLLAVSAESPAQMSAR